MYRLHNYDQVLQHITTNPRGLKRIRYPLIHEGMQAQPIRGQGTGPAEVKGRAMNFFFALDFEKVTA